MAVNGSLQRNPSCTRCGWVSRQVCLFEDCSARSGTFFGGGLAVPALIFAAIVFLAFVRGSLALGPALATVQASAFERHVTGCMGRGEGVLMANKAAAVLARAMAVLKLDDIDGPLMAIKKMKQGEIAKKGFLLGCFGSCLPP